MPSLRRARVAVLSAMTAQGSRRSGDVVVTRESPPLGTATSSMQASGPVSPSASSLLPSAVHFSPPAPAPPPTPARVSSARTPFAARPPLARLAAVRPRAPTAPPSAATAATATGYSMAYDHAAAIRAASITNLSYRSTSVRGGRLPVPLPVGEPILSAPRRRRLGLSLRPIVRKPQPPPRRPVGPRLPSPCSHGRPGSLHPHFRGDRFRQRPASVLWALPGGGTHESSSSSSTSEDEPVEFALPPDDEETQVQRVRCDDSDDEAEPLLPLGLDDAAGNGQPEAEDPQPAICVGGYTLSPLQSRPSSARSEPIMEGVSVSVRRYNHLRYVAPPKSASETQRVYDWRRYAPLNGNRETQDGYESRNNRDSGAESGTGGDRSLLITRSMNTSAPLMDDGFLAADDSEAECDARRGDVSDGDVRSPAPTTPPPAPPPSVATLRLSQPSAHQRPPGNAEVVPPAAAQPPSSARPPPRPPSGSGVGCWRARSCTPHTAHTTGCLPTAACNPEGGGAGGGGGGSGSSSRPVSPPSRPGSPHRWR